MSHDYSENILIWDSAGNVLRDELGWEVAMPTTPRSWAQTAPRLILLHMPPNPVTVCSPN